MLNDDLIQKFTNKFYGYGNYNAPYWFLGMEEGGGNSVEELNLRFSKWDARGKKELEDVAEYHFAIDIPELFSDKPKIQRTWSKQIRVLLGLTGEENDREVVRDYQKRYWGRENSENCIIELFPLPSPNTNNWIYGRKSNLPYLKNRKTYKSYFLKSRVKHIREKINKFSPKIVFMFGLTYIDYWSELVNQEFKEINRIHQSTFGKTKLVILKHPASRGIANDYFYNAGKMLLKNL